MAAVSQAPATLAFSGTSPLEREAAIASLLKQAGDFSQAGQYGSALNCYEQVLKLDPQNAMAQQGKASVAKLAQIEPWINEAKQFEESNRYDLALKRYEQVLNIDPYNIEARKGEERADNERSKYNSKTFDETRSRLASQLQAAWSAPVRRYADGANRKKEDLRMLDAAVDQYAIEHNKTASPTDKFADLPAGASSRRVVIAPYSPRFANERSVKESSEFQLSGENRYTGGARIQAGTIIAGQVGESESYPHHEENAFHQVLQSPLTTFSLDVDTASYANVRRFLNDGMLPPVDAVRIEELLNYFHYDYPQPTGDVPFSVNIETGPCPWQSDHRLVRVGLKARQVPPAERPPGNLVFLIDVSGSMNEPNKLALLKQCLHLLVQQMREDDKISIVVYAGEAGLVLPPTRGDQKSTILEAIDKLRAHGSTNGGEGIQLAYKTAMENAVPNGSNRVILATDGDFNVGTTNQDELVKLIEEKRKSGVSLSVLGMGDGNLKDATMQKLADHGNGNYAYIDSIREGHKVLVEQLGGTLDIVAKDVKCQVEFNPHMVSAYRLIGYEKRALRNADFKDDTKDAGDIGAGHTVTALYELVPADGGAGDSDEPLKYQSAPKQDESKTKPANNSKELLTLKLRYKKPGEEQSRLIETAVTDSGAKEGSVDFRFAASVAEFGMLLRNSPSKGQASWENVRELALDGQGKDEGGYRAEFLQLVEKAEKLMSHGSPMR
jgi:Ca-activated chloride channel family protein